MSEKSRIFGMFPRNQYNGIMLFYESEHIIYDTAYGVLQNFTDLYPDALTEDYNFDNMYVISNGNDTRKWYWNVLLIVVPLVYLLAFVLGIRNMIRGEKFDQS